MEVNVNKVSILIDPTAPAPQLGIAQPHVSQQNPALDTNALLFN